MCVEAGRDQYQLRLEAGERGLDDAVEGAEVLLVAGARAHRHVEGRRRLVVRPAGPGPERPLVQRDRQDGVVAAEDRLGAVPVVDVEVDDGDSLEIELVLRPASRDRGVREQTEAHRPLDERVVAGRPHEREAAPPHGLDRAAGGEEGSLVAGRRGHGVEVEPGRLGDRAQVLHVRVGVAAQYVLLRGGLARDEVRERLEQDGKPLLGLRVPEGGVELPQRRVTDDLHGSDPLGQSPCQLVHAPALEEGGRLCPRGGLIFEGRERGRGV